MITNYQLELLKRMGAGERLCKRHTEDGDQYFFAGGDIVRADSVRALFGQGVIRGAADGLFGDEQTYELNFMPEDAG